MMQDMHKVAAWQHEDTKLPCSAPETTRRSQFGMNITSTRSPASCRTKSKLTAAERTRRKEKSKYYRGLAQVLNEGHQFKAWRADWTPYSPLGEHKVTNQTRVSGVVLSVPGSVKHFRTQIVSEDAVIVVRDGQCEGRRKPVPEIIECGRIYLPEPCETTWIRQCICTQLTAPCMTPNGELYILVKYSNKEVWWVPVSKSEPLMKRGDSEKDQIGRERHRENPSSILDKTQTKLYEEVFQEASNALVTAGQEQRIQCVPTATAAAVDGLKPRQMAKLHANTSEMVELSFVFSSLTRREICKVRRVKQQLTVKGKAKHVYTNTTEATCLLKINALEEALRIEQSEEHDGYVGAFWRQQKEDIERTASKRTFPPKRKSCCGEDGCHAMAHSSSNYQYCYIHWEQKKCNNCNESIARRSGGLCNGCWNEAKECLSEEEKYCVSCRDAQYKRKPVKHGGLCAVCIASKVKLAKLQVCVDCKTNRRKCFGKICRACNKKRCNDDAKWCELVKEREILRKRGEEGEGL